MGGRPTRGEPADGPSITAAAKLSNERLISDWVRHHKADWSPATATFRVCTARLYVRWLPVPLIEATEDDCLRYHDHVVGRLSADSAAGYVCTMRSIHQYLTKVRKLRDDPTEDITPPKRLRYGHGRLPDPMPEAQLELAEDCAAPNPEMRAWLLLMGHHGLRRSDLAWMETRDLTPRPPAGGWLRITGKGRVTRSIPINEACMDAIRAYREWDAQRPYARRAPTVFVTRSGRAYSPDYLGTKITRFLKLVGIKDRKPHSLRHRFGTQYAKADPDIRNLQLILGHADPATTMIYTRVEPEAAARGLDALTARTRDRRRRKRSMRLVDGT